MKERGILFSAPMVLANLADLKTQTRRPVKNPYKYHPETVFVRDASPLEYWWPYLSDDGESIVCSDGNERPMPCPYGEVGDRLWVRETWASDEEDGQLIYRADVRQGGDADDWERGRREGVPRFRWTPAIHMPRTASRLTLEVTAVRVERLQDISEADAWAEGISACTVDASVTGRDLYRALWESINGPGSWAANPWVWVVSYKRVTS